MAFTQALAAGGLVGRRYGSFSGRGGTGRTVGTYSQPLAAGGLVGRRYGSFAGRGAAVPVGRPGFTQALAAAGLVGRRYGAFSGRLPGVVEPPAPAPAQVRGPDELPGGALGGAWLSLSEYRRRLEQPLPELAPAPGDDRARRTRRRRRQAAALLLLFNRRG